MSEENELDVEIDNQEELARIDIDARQIEADMIAAAQAKAQDPSEMAAQMFAMYVPHFKQGLSKLSTRGLRRVLQNAVLYPLEQGDIRTSSDFERQMVQLVSSLLECKFIMIMDTYKNNAEQLYDASQAELTPEETAGIQELINNEEKANG
jgi:hypothetical protein